MDSGGSANNLETRLYSEPSLDRDDGPWNDERFTGRILYMTFWVE